MLEFSELSRDGHPLVLMQVREPPGPVNQFEFTCAPDDPVFQALEAMTSEQEIVRAAGELLFTALAEAPALSPALTAALRIQPPDQRPIYVNVTGLSLGQALPWETLFAPAIHDFLSLDPRWPVGRIVPGARPEPTPWRLDPPLRIAAVLSCLGVPADEEWQALRAAVEESGLDCRVCLLVSENELYQRIEAARLPWADLAKVPSDYAGLQSLITRFNPHVLHLFCHGSTGHGGPHLEVAVGSDWLTGTADRSHFLESRGIRELTPVTAATPWLIVLNACESATPATLDVGPQTLASALVADYAVPAVVGMRQPVLSVDAARFTRRFYASLFETLRRALDRSAAELGIDWASLAVTARDALRRGRDSLPPTSAAARTTQWTLPVVHVRPTQFMLQIVTPAALGPESNRARLESSLLEALLAALPADTPAQTIDALTERLRQRRELALGRS
ncbi:MAG TPA: CHAT domain-containing protein [Micromonosporaceae bacterium]